MMAAAMGFPFSSGAQGYPVRPIHGIVGYGPGGVTDVTARIVADAMGKALGQAIIIENRPGASSLLAANLVKTATPDGYTILIGPTTGFAPVFIKDNAILASKELAPVSNITYGVTFLYASSSIGVNSLKDLVNYAKQHPSKVRFASVATSNSLNMVLIAKHLGLAYDDIPYKTTEQTIAALLSDDAQITLNALPGFEAHLKSGKLKVIGALSPQRTDLLPDAATLAEQGVPLTHRFSNGIWAPLGTPQAVIGTLNKAARSALADPSVVSRLKALSLSAAPSTPEELIVDLDSQLKLFGEAAALAGFKPQ
jgi:tripartite-type tricarboxylate transporter receptor subunit TctC